MRIRFLHFMAIPLLLAMLGCSSTDPVTNNPPQPAPSIEYTFAHFDPSTGNPQDIPIPNDLLRNPFTGQNQIPLPGEPFSSVNSLFGFSTTAPIVVPFAGTVNANSVNGNTMPVVDLVDLAAAGQGAQVNPFKTMAYQVVTNPDSGDSTVVIAPVVPLKPGRPHMVIITDGVMGSPSNLPVESEALTILLKGETPFIDGNGNSTRASLNNATAAALEPLRQIYQNIWATAETITGQDRLFIPFCFVFSTQPLHQTLPAMRQRLQSETPVPAVSLALPTPEAVDAFYQSTNLGSIPLSAVPHNAVGQLYKGTFNAPQFLTHPLAGFFQGSGANVAEVRREDINFWAALPVGAQGPVPVMIFQHGFLSVKEVFFIIANAACSAGIGVVAIDAVLHGERVGDFFNNETGALGPDGLPDPSGSGAINPASPRTMRDNFRQTVLDLVVLTRMITSGATDFNGDGSPEFAPVGVTYTGQSLGGIIGSIFTPIEPNVSLAVLNVPGGRFFTLFPGSQEVAPLINAGLAEVGIFPGTVEYTLFFLALATVLDDVDPMNLGTHINSGSLAGGSPTVVLVQEMIGDTVVPNANTRDLARAIGIPQVAGIEEIAGLPQVPAPFVGPGIYQFEGGSHGFLLAPDPNTAAGQLQAITFLGTGLQGNPTIIDPFAAKNGQGLEAMPYFEMDPPDWSRAVYFPK